MDGYMPGSNDFLWSLFVAWQPHDDKGQEVTVKRPVLHSG